MNNQGILSNRNIAAFILIFMSIQLCWLEGFETSVPKTLMMALSPLFILARSPRFSTAIFTVSLFLIVTASIYYLQYRGNEMTFIHMALMWSLFCLFYNLVHIEGCFLLDDAIKVVKTIVYIYFFFLIAQQLLFVLGVRVFHPLNMYGLPYYRLFRLPAAAIEPSHAARILTVCGYAFLKLNEYKFNRPISIQNLLINEWPFLFCFLYTMLAIGSGTSVAGLALLSLYFLKIQYAFTVVLFMILAYVVIPYVSYEPLRRAWAVFNATMSWDVSEIAATDQSASYRVGTVLSTIQNLNIFNIKTWFGYGFEGKSVSLVEGIKYYGLISFSLKFIILLRCCFNRLFSFGTLAFVVLLSLDVRNFAYAFAMIMLLSVVKYFDVCRQE